MALEKKTIATRSFADNPEVLFFPQSRQFLSLDEGAPTRDFVASVPCTTRRTAAVEAPQPRRE